MLLGRVVTNTIAGGIADPRMFARQPEVYAWGMVSRSPLYVTPRYCTFLCVTRITCSVDAVLTLLC
jgi:hypothetical protein